MFVESCEACQKRVTKRYDEPLYPTWMSTIWEKVGLDIVHMPKGNNGVKYLVLAHDDLSRWVEGRALVKATVANIAKFVYEDIIT